MFDTDKALHKAWTLGYSDEFSVAVLKDALAEATYEEAVETLMGVVPLARFREIYDAGL